MLSDTLGRSLETSTEAGTRQFCFSCHTALDTGRGWDSDEATYAAVGAGDAVAGIPRTGGVLRLRSSVAAHNEASIESCGLCHGSDYRPGGSNVHNPGRGYDEALHTAAPFTSAAQGAGSDGLVPTGGFECSACHSATLAPAHASTSTSGGNVTCSECHSDTTLGSSSVVAANWPTKTCVECHDSGAATTHGSYTTTHTVDAGSCADTGAGCHNARDLAQLHAQSQSGGTPKYQSCANSDPTDPSGCHNVIDKRPQSVSAAASCGEGTSGCHQEKTPTNHGYTAATHAATLTTGTVPLFSNHMNVGRTTNYYVVCSDCHNAELGPVHANLCSTCHPSPRNSFTVWDKSCTQAGCHTTYHEKATVTHDAIASGNCDNCHVGGSEDLVADPCGSCHAHYNASDTTPPITTSDALPVYSGAAVVNFHVSDSGLVGISNTFYRIEAVRRFEGTRRS